MSGSNRIRIANGAAIRTLREQRGWSQAELAAQSGCALRTVRRAEESGSATEKVLQRLANVLSAAWEELLAPENERAQAVEPAARCAGPVFVSHSSHDYEFIERELLTCMHRIGIQTWYSRIDIRPIEAFEPRLVRGLEESKSFLLVMSSHSVNSDWVKAEVHWAIKNRWPDRIIPILIEDCKREHFHLWMERLQFIDFRQDREKARTDLAALFGATWPPSATIPPTAQPKPLSAARAAVPDIVAVDRVPANLRMPTFHCGAPVSAEFFIGRQQELEDAEAIIRSGQSFLIVGVRRAGKTSFCNKLQQRLSARKDNDLLSSQLNLESCRDLTIETFLGHTILNMVGEIAREVFHVKPTDLDRPDPTVVRPELRNDAAFDSLVMINRFVTERTHYRPGEAASPFRQQEFVRHVTDLLDIIRSKGWRHYAIFYDEANRLPAQLSVALLNANIEILNAAALTTVYAASPEMADSFLPLHNLFGHQIRIGPFESQRDLVSLLARYYHGDMTQTDDLPVSADALQLLWDEARGMPFQLQFLLSYSFQHARIQRSGIVTEQHVREAHALLSRERPDYFGRSAPHL